MEILQLKYFCLAAECENFSKTAERFGVPPSDVSQSIKRLEKELGVPLFDRRANSVTLNEAGRSFYGKASEALLLLTRGARELKDRGDEGKISIAININRRIVMRAVEKFRIEYPKVDISVKHSVFSGLSDFDLVITSEDMSGEGMVAEKLLCDRIALAVNRRDPLAEVTEITARELMGKPFVSMNVGDSIHALTLQVGERFGFEPRIAIQSDDPFYIRRCVELGLGIAVFPALSWEGLFSEEVVLKDLGDYTRDTFLCRRADRYTSKCTEAFLSFLRAEFAEAGHI